MFERFTDRARRVLVLAQEEARLLNHSFIGTEHLLLGLVHENEGVAAQALSQLGITVDDVRGRVEELLGTTAYETHTSPPFTPRAKKVLELSLREAHQLGHHYIGTEHMLLGLVREGEGVGARVLIGLGADLARVRQKVIELLAGTSGEVSGVVAPPAPIGRSFGGPTAELVACSFCGRQPPATGQVVRGNDAFICEHCVRRWSSRLGGLSTQSGGVASYIYRPVEPTGPPPDDQDAARSEITAAFADHPTPSGDGQALPLVEGGDNLGPLPSLARERRGGFVPGGTEFTTTVDEIVFIDAEHAAVWFTISIDGNPLLQWRRGEAVVVDGHWKMSRSTFCELVRLAGVDCPPTTSTE